MEISKRDKEKTRVEKLRQNRIIQRYLTRSQVCTCSDSESADSCDKCLSADDVTLRRKNTNGEICLYTSTSISSEAPFYSQQNNIDLSLSLSQRRLHDAASRTLSLPTFEEFKSGRFYAYSESELAMKLTLSDSDPTDSEINSSKWDLSSPKSILDLTPNDQSFDVKDCEKCEELEGKNALCKICSKKRVERRETLLEIRNTEYTYGRDLKLMRHEILEPMKKSCLLNDEEVDVIFINLEELINVGDKLLETLCVTILQAEQQSDNYLTSVNIGEIFLKCSNLFLAFQKYCINHRKSVQLLENLEKERELFKIFLEVSQNDNESLRRMHLKSFLILPVQRVMKYPLLLERIIKTTTWKTEDLQYLQNAKTKLEAILEHINQKSQGQDGQKFKKFRRYSMHHKRNTSCDNIELLNLALDAIQWSHSDTTFVHSGTLQYVTYTEIPSIEPTKYAKLQTCKAILISKGNATLYNSNSNMIKFPKSQGENDAALVLFKEKGGKLLTVREPVFFARSIVSRSEECATWTTLLEVGKDKEGLRVVSTSDEESEKWHAALISESLRCGKWRNRRPARANIILD